MKPHHRKEKTNKQVGNIIAGIIIVLAISTSIGVLIMTFNGAYGIQPMEDPFYVENATIADIEETKGPGATCTLWLDASTNGTKYVINKPNSNRNPETLVEEDTYNLKFQQVYTKWPWGGVFKHGETTILVKAERVDN